MFLIVAVYDYSIKNYNPAPPPLAPAALFLSVLFLMIIYFFLTALGLAAGYGPFPAAVTGGYSPVTVHRLLNAASSLAVEHRLQGTQTSVAAAHALSSCGSQALEHRLNSCGTWV